MLWEKGMTSEYRKAPGFNQSTAKVLLDKSPRHAWEYAQRQPGAKDDDHSRDREIGTVVHALLLGATSEVVEIAADNYRTNIAKETRAAAEMAGKTPILAPDMARAMRACRAAQEQMAAFGLELDGESEVPFYWREEGLRCKAQLDHIMADGLTVLDIKTGDDANPRRLTRRIIDTGLHVQAAAYLRALAAERPETAGRARFIDVFVETSGMVLVTPVEIAGSLLELGERRWLRACATWQQCDEAGVWPGYTTRILRPEAPAWAMTDELIQEEA